MSAHDTSFADATRMVEKEVNAFVEILHEEGKADLENVGEIRYNIYGNYEFTPYDHKITTPSLYGLDSFEMRELSALQRRKNTGTCQSDERKEKRMKSASAVPFFVMLRQ